MHNVTKISSDTTIAEAARIMDQKVIGSVLVEENGNVIGVMTERDILRKIVAKGKNPEETTVKEIMNTPLITIDANSSLEEASNVMTKHEIRRLIITENDAIVGIITARGIAKNMRYSLGKRVLKNYKTEHYRPSYGKPE
jgi:CBS domain-containing protein